MTFPYCAMNGSDSRGFGVHVIVMGYHSDNQVLNKIAATLMVTGVAQILGRLITVLTDANSNVNATIQKPLIRDKDKLMALLALLFLSLVFLCLSVRLAVNLVGLCTTA